MRAATMDRKTFWMLLTGLFLLAVLFAPLAARAGLRWDVRPENRTVLVPGPGDGAIQIEIFAPDEERPRRGHDRPPLNIALVIDRSGSMSEYRKLDYAIAAAHEMIDRLGPEDTLAIVAYDHLIETVLPAQRVRDRRHLHSVIDSLYPRGNTNLWGGVEAGFRQIGDVRRNGRFGRVLLISDGLANTGLTDRWEMARRIGRMAGDGISFSTFGVGTSFDEELLAAVATNGGGSYYYLEHPGEMARVLDEELGNASRVCAAEVEIVIRLRPGWIFSDVAGYEWRREGDDVIVRLGDLSAGARRTLLTRMRIEGGKPGRREAADVRIRYRDPESGKILKEDPRQVELEVVEDRQVYEKNFVPEVRERKAVIESNEAMRDASRMVDKGDRVKALGLLRKQEAALAAAPPCPSVQAELKANQEYQEQIKEMDRMPADEANAVQKKTKFRSYQELFQK